MTVARPAVVVAHRADEQRGAAGRVVADGGEAPRPPTAGCRGCASSRIGSAAVLVPCHVPWPPIVPHRPDFHIARTNPGRTRRAACGPGAPAPPCRPGRPWRRPRPAWSRPCGRAGARPRCAARRPRPAARRAPPRWSRRGRQPASCSRLPLTTHGYIVYARSPAGDGVRPSRCSRAAAPQRDRRRQLHPADPGQLLDLLLLQPAVAADRHLALDLAERRVLQRASPGPRRGRTASAGRLPATTSSRGDSK